MNTRSNVPLAAAAPTAANRSYARAPLPPYGTGYGRSSGYVRSPSYLRETLPARFGLR